MSSLNPNAPAWSPPQETPSIRETPSIQATPAIPETPSIPDTSSLPPEAEENTSYYIEANKGTNAILYIHIDGKGLCVVFLQDKNVTTSKDNLKGIVDAGVIARGQQEGKNKDFSSYILPGGHFNNLTDANIIDTILRELNEEMNYCIDCNELSLDGGEDFEIELTYESIIKKIDGENIYGNHKLAQRNLFGTILNIDPLQLELQYRRNFAALRTGQEYANKYRLFNNKNWFKGFETLDIAFIEVNKLLNVTINDYADTYMEKNNEHAWRIKNAILIKDIHERTLPIRREYVEMFRTFWKTHKANVDISNPHFIDINIKPTVLMGLNIQNPYRDLIRNVRTTNQFDAFYNANYNKYFGTEHTQESRDSKIFLRKNILTWYTVGSRFSPYILEIENDGSLIFTDIPAKVDGGSRRRKRRLRSKTTLRKRSAKY